MHCWQKNTAGGEQVTGPPSSLTWKPLPAPPHAPSSARRPQSDITSRFPLAFRRTLCVTTTEERGENGAIRHGCPARRHTSQGQGGGLEERTGRSDTDALQDGVPAKGREEASSCKRLRPVDSPAASRPRGVYLITHPGPSDLSERVGQRDPSSSLSHQLCDARRQAM